MRIRFACPLAALLAFAATPALGQTTGGVFGPGVAEGDRSAQWRVAWAPGEGGRQDRIASRLHYQHAVSPRLRFRGVVQGSDVETGDFELNFVQFETHWQFSKAPKWKSALRVDTRLVEGDDGENQVGLDWTNQWPLKWFGGGERTSLTVVGLSNIRLKGDSSVGLETRAAITHRLEGSPWTVALQSFDAYGRTRNFPRLEDQNHRVGPSVSRRFGDVDFRATALFGWSEAAQDIDVALWVGKRF